MENAEYQIETEMLSPAHALMYILGAVTSLGVCMFLYAQLFQSLMA